MQTLYEIGERSSGETQTHEADPSSDSYAVTCITNDRDEVLKMLHSVADDPRVSRFLMEYNANYEKLILSHSNRLGLRDEVRDLTAKVKVSEVRSEVVEETYKNTDDHHMHLRREINIVYHKLIELQEAEDKSTRTIADLTQEVAELNAKIRERLRGVTRDQLKERDERQQKYDEVNAERAKVVGEVDRLREDIADLNTQQIQLEKDHLRLDEGMAETHREFARVNNEVAKENQKRSKLRAALQAGQTQFNNRQKDMEDLKKQLSESNVQAERIAEGTHALTVQTEKIRIHVNSVVSKIRSKQVAYEEQMHELQQIENETSKLSAEFKKQTHELEMIAEMTASVDKTRLMLKNKVKEVDHKKEGILKKNHTGKQKNQELTDEICNTKREMERAVKRQTDLLRQRDFVHKNLMKLKAATEKDHMFLVLHQLSNKRLTQDNACLVAQANDQHAVIKKLENERDIYLRQVVKVTKKALAKGEEEKKAMEQVFVVMKLIAGEEMKFLETQNLYEATRNEHALYTRHILQLRDCITGLKLKATAMTYESRKLLQERDYRDECLLKEDLALQKLSRQIFVLKANLKDLKETNARTKMIIENQDLEEKNLIKMTRVMKLERVRETKGMERVIRDIDGLDLALTRRYLELHELYKTVKLKQSLLEKGENMYKKRWREWEDVHDSLQRAKAHRRLDSINRQVVDRLMSCVNLLKTHLENVQLRRKGLMEELSHPRNIHRWRNLLGRDPEAYHSVRNLHTLRFAIQEKVEYTTATMTQIHQLDREYISLTTSVLAQPSPETVLQLKLYQDELTTRHRQIKNLTAELREALDNKTDMTARCKTITRKLNKIRNLWLKHMRKEKKRQDEQSLNAGGPLLLIPGPGGLPPEVKTLLGQLSPLRKTSEEKKETPVDGRDPPGKKREGGEGGGGGGGGGGQ